MNDKELRAALVRASRTYSHIPSLTSLLELAAKRIEEYFPDTVPQELEPVPKKNIKYYLSCLEKFPRVKTRIESTWGTVSGRKYIFELIVDNRDRHANKVNGFPETAINAINILLELHDEFYPECKPVLGVWDENT